MLCQVSIPAFPMIHQCLQNIHSAGDNNSDCILETACFSTVQFYD